MSTSFKGYEPWAASRFGVEAASVLQEALNWTDFAERNGWHEHEGLAWFQHTGDQWCEDLPFIPRRSLERAIALLVKDGVLVRRLGWQRKTFYRVDYDRFEAGRREMPARRPKRYSEVEPPPDPIEPDLAVVEPQSRPAKPAKSHYRQNGITVVPGGNGEDAAPITAKLADHYRQPGGSSLSLEEQIKEQSQGCETPPALAPAFEVLEPLPKKRPAQREQRNALEKASKRAVETTDGSKVWEAYREAYERAYGVTPARNAESNRHAKKVAESMLLEEAIAVASFYLTCRTAFYVSKQHSIRYLAQDCDGLRTQMLRGVRVTTIGARQTERQAEMREQLARLTAEDKEEGLPW